MKSLYLHQPCMLEYLPLAESLNILEISETIILDTNIVPKNLSRLIVYKLNTDDLSSLKLLTHLTVLDQKLQKFPPNLIYLNITHFLVSQIHNLPQSLITLKIKSISDDTNDNICNWSYLINLKSFILNDLCDNDILPPNLICLKTKLYDNILCKNDTFSISFPKSLIRASFHYLGSKTLIFPNTILHLKLWKRGNPSVIVLPNQLQSLSIDIYNKLPSLPNTIEKLSIDSYFLNDSTILPSNLKKLKIKTSQPHLNKIHLPPFVEVIYIYSESSWIPKEYENQIIQRDEYEFTKKRRINTIYQQ